MAFILPQISNVQWSLNASGCIKYTSSLSSFATTKNSESDVRLHLSDSRTEEGGWNVEITFIVFDFDAGLFERVTLVVVTNYRQSR